MAIDTASLARIGIHISPQELEERIAAALRDIVPARVVANPVGELSPEEAAALARGGLDLSPQGSRESDGSAENVLVRTASEYAALLASSSTVAEVARRLQVDGSRIRQRLAARTLYGIKHGNSWLLPTFQFHNASLVPRIDQVLPHLSPSLRPLAVLRWFLTPNVDLVQGPDETPVGPRAWLCAGNPPEPVVDLARHAGASH